jgi:hypothetical protein
MDEKYLSELWNWTNSQDPTFKDRYTFDSWSKKLKSNEGYKKQFYGWVSGIDETFEERRPYNAWSEMVSTDKKKEESALFSREGGTLSATPGTGEVGLSGFTRSSRYDEVLPGAVEPPVQREAAPVVQTISPKQQKEAKVNLSLSGMGDEILDAFEQGLTQGGVVDPSMVLMIEGKEADESEISNFIQKYKKMEESGPSRSMQKWKEDFDKTDKGIWGFLKTSASNPLAVTEIAVSSLAALINKGSAEAAGATIATGTAAGAGLGALAGGAGAAPGAITGLVKSLPEAFTVAGATMETALSFGEFLKEEVEKKGLKFDEEGVSKILEDKDAMFRVRSRAAGRGITIGLIDRFTMGVASGIVRGAAATTGRRAIAAAMGTGVEMVGGAAGEAAARAVAGQEMDVAEIGFEALGEIGTAPVSIAKGILSRPSYKINGEEVSGPEMAKYVRESGDKDFAGMKVEIKNDDALKSVASERKEKLRVKKDVYESVKKSVGAANEEDINAIVDLEIKKKDLANKRGSKSKEELKNIDSQIDEIYNKIESEDYAVQEQTTSEVPVQPETAVGEEVAEGTPQAESEVAAEEGKEEVAKQYADDLKETKDSDPEQYWSVNSVSEEAAKEGTVITDEDGGVVVSKEGDIKGLFKRASSKAKGVAQKLLQKAIDAGGKKLDNFDTYLTPIYKKAGFRVVSRIPFNEEYAPDGWNKEKHGTPDVVAMVYDPNNELNIEERTFEDYDEARAYRDSYVEQARAETGQQQTLAAEQGTPTTIEGTGLRENIKKSIAKVFNNFDTKSFKNAKEMASYAKAKFNEETGDRDSARIFVGSDGKVEILVNEELADDTALGHEVWHALLLKAFGDNQAKFAEFRGAIDKTLRQNGYEDIADALDEFSSQYTEEGEVPAEEYLAQLGGLMTSANIDLKKLTPAQKSLLQQIKDIINDFAIQLTGQPVFLKEATPETILDFMSTMSDMMAKGEDISQFFGDGTPGSTMTGGVVSRAQIGKDSVDSQFDMSIEYDDSNMPDDLEMPDPQTIEKVLEASGGAAIFINSDGTKVGITRDKKKLQGGWRYAYFKENIDDNIGFAATSETHVGTFYDLMQKVAKERDEANPEMAGKPVAIFVTIQNSESMLGEWYAGEFLMDGLDKAITEKKTTVAKARKLMDVAISETQKRYIESEKKADLKKKNKNSKHKLRTTEEIKKDVAYKQLESLKKIIDEKGFDTHEGRIKAAKELGSKDFSFGFRSSFLKTLIPLKSATGNNKEIKKLLLEVGYGRKDFYKDTMDEVLYDALEKANFDEASIGGSTFGGFYADPSVSKEKFIANKNKGIQHDMFNESFSSNGKTFRLDKPRNVNKLFPSMGFPDSEGYDVYNKANNAKASKASGIMERNNVSKWLLENGYEKNVTNPFTAISGTMYTSTIDSDYQVEEPKVVTRAQKAQPTEATENDFVLPFGKYKGQWYSTTPKNYKEFLLKQDWFDPRKYFAKTLENANESFGTEDGEVNFKSRAQKIDKKKTKELSSSIINNFNDEELESAKSLINKVEPPNKTTKAYKLFKVKKEFPGELFPLFVGANESVTTGEWIEAKEGEVKVDEKTGKKTVKSTLGPLAYRPGWHSGDSPMATHIGSKAKKEDKKPTFRSDNHVWAEVEVGDDFNWQKVATERAEITKEGKINVSTAHITDQVPLRGFYRYKTNPNMTGNWIISGEMKVNRVLTEKEVEEINKKSNAKDLPRLTPFDYEAYGFDKNGSVKNTKQVIANQIARAYQVAKENGENAELVSFVEKKAITRAQKAQPQTITGYDRMIGEAKSIVEKSKKRGVSADQIVENVINYIQKSRVYERADDLQREQIIRDARKDLGLRQKSAPRVDRVLGIKDSVSTEDKKNLMEVIKAQVKATKNLVKAQKEIAKQINKEIRELKEKGKITTSQMIAALRRLSEVDLLNEESVSNFLDYIARVFKDAAYYERVTNINRKRRAARNSASTKIGIADGLTPLLQKIFSIDARTIPEKALDAYEELVNMFADRSRVLQLSDIENVTNMAQKVFEAVEGEVERARSLAEVLSNYENMATDENGNIEFSKTVDQMVNDGSISAEDGELMKKYKSMILEEAGLKKEKDVRSEEEIEEERQQLVETVRNYTPVFFQLPTQDERDVAREIFRLIKTGAIDKMSNKDLKDLLRIIDNIERGFLPHSAQIMKERMNQINNGETLSEAVNNAKMLPVESRYAKIKALFGGSEIRKAIDRNPLFFIDELFGNFKSRPIFDSIFKPISRAFSSYQSEVNTINRKIQNAMDELSNSLGKNPNKMQFAKQKIMAYMLESEYQANPNSKEVRSAKDFLDATIKYAEETEQNSYSEKDIENLKKIRDEFFSGETIDLDAMLESFSPAEKKAIKTISDINNELSSKVAFTSAIIRGRKVGALNNYIHHNTLGERSAADIATEVSMADVFNASMRPSTKAKSLIERTGAATPLVFDPFSSTTRGARQLLMDYHLTEPIRTARRTVKYAESKVTGKQKRILNAISGALEQALSNTLINTYHETTFVEDAIRYMEQTGYRAMLGSIPRAVAELTSNLSYVMLYDPASFKSGISKYRSVAMSEAGLSVMKNVKSQQTERLYPASKLSGRGLDKEVMSQASGIKAGKSQNDVMNAMTVAYNYSGKQVKNVAEATADALIGSPDKAIMKPLWFGAFASEFKKATGQDVDYDKIANNNEAYLTEFSEAIDQAAQHADETSVRVGASDNPFTGILKGANAANQSAMKQAFNKFNNFMSRFLIYEYTTARTGVYALMGNGKLTQKQGAAILGATMSRMIVYSLLSTELVSIMMGMLGFGDDEEDEKTFFQKLGQATGSALSGLILGRNFGNFTKAPINIGVEKVNEKFLDFLREGDYDPYEDAIQYTIIPKDERKKGDIMEYVKSFSGAFSPMIGTMQRTLEVAARDPKTQAAQERRLRELSTRTPLEILGNTGYIPLYRDVRKIVMESLYEDMRKEKKGGGSGGIKTSIDTKIK